MGAVQWCRWAAAVAAVTVRVAMHSPPRSAQDEPCTAVTATINHQPPSMSSHIRLT